MPTFFDAADASIERLALYFVLALIVIVGFSWFRMKIDKGD